ncbi:hypothetical protein [Cupriavidus nantongensis]|uniref:hypothetical protein n=1 Tax=Cupriavidus nantongensis TaxID=1796606 RepID=UPI000A532D7B|nr:hypothetical protein [Cupriavidus nantongensis]
MIFTALRPDGTRERRRHVPYRLTQSGADWLAHHAETGRKIGRFNDKGSALSFLNAMTEPAPRQGGKQ